MTECLCSTNKNEINKTDKENKPSGKREIVLSE